MLKYCIKCMMPETKPDLSFKDGVCNACRNFENRKKINWDDRKKQLISILEKYKNKTNNYWNCVIPVSGGKDSTYQVVTALKLGMHPLCVTSRTCDLSKIGRDNLDNIRNLGVDLIEVGPDAKTRYKLNRIGLLELGDISWPEHIGIFTIPVRIAVNFKIPLRLFILNVSTSSKIINRFFSIIGFFNRLFFMTLMSSIFTLLKSDPFK